MFVIVRNGNIEQAVRSLKKKLWKEGTAHTVKLRSIAKPSERRKEKERTALRRKIKKAKRACGER
jgi:small subunit ribosomal protein S21